MRPTTTCVFRAHAHPLLWYPPNGIVTNSFQRLVYAQIRTYISEDFCLDYFFHLVHALHANAQIVEQGYTQIVEQVCKIARWRLETSDIRTNTRAFTFSWLVGVEAPLSTTVSSSSLSNCENSCACKKLRSVICFESGKDVDVRWDRRTHVILHACALLENCCITFSFV